MKREPLALTGDDLIWAQERAAQAKRDGLSYFVIIDRGNLSETIAQLLTHPRFGK